VKRALHPQQAADVRGHIDQAIAQVRACIEAAPDVGPVLVSAYRALSALGELRETIDALPIVRGEASE
jgi:hypothetical protein